MSSKRLDQLLANLGYCSRREARSFLRRQSVTGTDGARLTDPSQKIYPRDIRVDGEPLDHPDGLLLLVNKPLGLTCSHDPREAPLIHTLFPARWQNRKPLLTTIGRLDKDTSGLILVTDQAALVHRLTSPRNKIPKVYRVSLDRALCADLVPLFASGTLQLTGEKHPCAPAELTLIEPRLAELTLVEGKYHQVRRMFAAAGNHVTALHRIRFGPLALGDLPSGHWRELPPDTFASI